MQSSAGVASLAEMTTCCVTRREKEAFCKTELLFGSIIIFRSEGEKGMSSSNLNAKGKECIGDYLGYGRTYPSDGDEKKKNNNNNEKNNASKGSTSSNGRTKRTTLGDLLGYGRLPPLLPPSPPPPPPPSPSLPSLPAPLPPTNK